MITNVQVLGKCFSKTILLYTAWFTGMFCYCNLNLPRLFMSGWGKVLVSCRSLTDGKFLGFYDRIYNVSVGV